jgi:hypothetical protein
MRPKLALWSDQGILSPKGRRAGSRVASAVMLCAVVAIASGGVYSQISAEREVGTPAAVRTARPAAQTYIPVGALNRPSEAGTQPAAQPAPPRSASVSRGLGTQIAAIGTPPQAPLRAAAVDLPTFVPDAELAPVKPANAEPPAAKPDEKPRPAKKKSARSDANAHRTANGSWNPQQQWGNSWGNFWGNSWGSASRNPKGGSDNSGRSGRHAQAANPGLFRGWQ